jgi:hypothetical protein
MPDLSDGINWSEVDANNNQAPPNGWPEGMMPSGVNDAARADRGALKRFWDKVNPIQSITPSGGVWTFTTVNPAYPTAYVSGEIYAFRPTVGSVGSDQFQVNGLSPRPIWKCAASGSAGWIPIIAQDMRQGFPATLVYDASQNSGAGCFVLLNPFVPVSGDGAGGASVPGSLTVAGGLAVNGGDLMLGRTDQAYGSITRPNTAGFNNLALGSASAALDDVTVYTTTMEVTGPLSATGYTSRSGLGGPYQTNAFNIQWDGAAAHLWVDTVDHGPIITAPGGNISGGNLTISGDLTATGILRTNSTGPSTGGVSVYATAGAIQSDRTGTALYLPNGDISAQNIVLAGSNAGGGGSNLALLCNNGGVQVSRSGTAFYAPNGNVVCQQVIPADNILAGHNIYPTTDNVRYCGLAGNAWYEVRAYNFPNASDPSLKRDIKPVPVGCLDLVRAIEPQTYSWATGPEEEEGRVHWGFMAPEVAEVMKRAGQRFDAIRTDEGISSLAYNEMIAVLWAAVRELAEKLETK